MRARKLNGKAVTPEEVEGRVLVHDLGPDLRKGTVLTRAHLDRVQQAGEVHVVELEPGDLHEDVAAKRLAAALSGPNLTPKPPVQSQARLVAARRGLVRVRAELVDAINALGYVSVFTLMDGQAVAEGEEVAGCKVTPVAVPGGLIEDVERIARERGPVVELLPFLPLRTFVVATERLKPKARDLFRAAVTGKLGWYGAEVLAVREVARTPAAVADAYREATEKEAELILFAGASAIDPLDPAYAELTKAGGELLQLGAPMHPGSMLWLGRLDGAAVVGVASCAGFGRSSSLDLLLPFVFAYGRADANDLLRLGHGGLIESAAGRRFPPYSNPTNSESAT
jgi:molybdenum cofactor cytidylyltransferase